MDALILAAGIGSRLRDAEPCKPLTRIHGLSLIELSIRQLMAVGVTRIVVATGYQAELVEAELFSIASRLNIMIVPRRVSDFSQANGYSILAAADALGDQFLLVMADHILSGEILRCLAMHSPPDSGAVLAIDRRTSSDLVDPDDATWVLTETDGKIMQIGKTIPSYNAVDCGAFSASRGLFRAIEAAIGAGKAGSLSDGMQYLADAGLADTRDIGDAWWIDVDEPQSLATAKQQVTEHLAGIFIGADCHSLDTVLSDACT